MEEITLIRYIQGNCDKDEQQAVERWYDESPNNRKELEQLYYTLFLGDRIDVMNSVDTEVSLEKFKSGIRNSKRVRLSSTWNKYILLAAAFIAGLIFAGGVTWNWVTKNKSEYVLLTTAGQRAQTILPDGSKVWLNSSTKIVYHNSLFSSQRRVDITGEAYFEVTHNSHIPFIVTNRGVSTKVLGTKFNVRARENEEFVITTLLEGLVNVTTPTNENGRRLVPGQSAMVNTKTYKERLTTYKYPDEILLWMNDDIIFNQTTLSDIARILEKMYNVEFIFSNEKLKKERFTAKFPTSSSLDEILNVISHTNHFKYRKDGRNVYIIAM